MKKYILFPFLFLAIHAQEELPCVVELAKIHEGFYEMFEKRDVDLEILLSTAAAENDMRPLLGALLTVLRTGELDDYLICSRFFNVLSWECDIEKSAAFSQLLPEERVQFEAILAEKEKSPEAQRCFLRPYIEHRQAFYEQLKQVHNKQAADKIAARLGEFDSSVHWTRPPEHHLEGFEQELAAPLIALRQAISVEFQRIFDADCYGSDELKRGLAKVDVPFFAFLKPMKPLQFQWEELLREGGVLEIATWFTPVTREDIYQQLLFPLILPFLQQAEGFHFVAFDDSMGYERLIFKAKGELYYTCCLYNTNCDFVLKMSVSEQEEEIRMPRCARVHEFSSLEEAFKWFNK